jgi:hypothetical protein
MMRTPIRAGLIVAITLGTAFCGGRTASTETAEPAGQTTLVVDNQSTLQVTVYVLRDAQRQRLGIAESLQYTSLRIPDNIMFGPTTLRFEISPLGSRSRPISMQITVSPGERVTLRVPPTLR